MPRRKTVVKVVPVDSLETYPGNARKANADGVKESLTEHDQYRTIVVQKSTNRVLAGNNTYLQAQALGWKDIRAEFVECDDKEAHKIVLVDNKLNDDAVYDNAALAKLLEDLDGDYSGTGFDEGDLNKLLDQLKTDDDKVDTVPGYGIAPSRVSEGDVWILGPHRLVCGSSTEADVLDSLFGQDERIDLVFMDPPYGVDYQGDIANDPELAKRLNRRTDGNTISSDNLGKEGTEQLIYEALTIAPIREGCAIYVCAPQGDMYPIIWNAVQMAGLSLRQQIVWVKDRFVMGRSDYHYRHENIMYGWKEGKGHYWIGDRDQDSVWIYDRPGNSKEHPTMKPIELVERAVLNSSQRGDIVFDPFGGSGTTLLASERHKRNCRIVELDPTYCEVIVSRWEAYTGRKAELLVNE